MFDEKIGLYSPELSYTFTDEEEDDDLSSPPTPTMFPQNTLFRDGKQSYPPPKVSEHLIFVIHGIGQQTEKFGMFHHHMRSLRDTLTQVLQARQPHQPVRIELIPIEWHRHIHQETDATLQSTLPKSLPTVRLIESDYLADALFYFSIDRGQSIINHCTQLFNNAYHEFMERRPDFSGKVAILGYSLGGLISWDILSHQRKDLTPAEKAQFAKFDVQVPTLDFKPDYLFGMGCPVAGLLTARNQDPRLYHPDANVHFENIYHSYDPLAFRMEPLLNADYIHTPPVMVDRAIPASSFLSSWAGRNLFSFFTGKGGQEPQQGILSTSMATLMQMFYRRPSNQEDDNDDLPEIQHRRASEGDIAAIQSKRKAHHRSRSRSNSLPSGNRGDDILRDSILVPSMVVDSSTWPVQECLTPATTAVPEISLDMLLAQKVADLPGGRRWDYELTPDRLMGMISNEYIQGLTAHFSYWTNKDMLWHIFRRMEHI